MYIISVIITINYTLEFERFGKAINKGGRKHNTVRIIKEKTSINLSIGKSMKSVLGFNLKNIFIALVSVSIPLTLGAAQTLTVPESSCVTCHTDLKILKKTLSKTDRKESALIEGMG
ncbi:MAG TPA: hypothetical protein VMW42_04200 [Desulfatiglandales bacterium]|nr:hypothetical protein [Desulfatiglandales bacterium]